MLDDERLRLLAHRLTAVGGVRAVLLGGSRARGDHTPGSDVDLGLYYRGPLDVAALGALAREVAGDEARVSRPGEWGPWVDGGGWLRIDGTAVDWIYRDLDRVHACWRSAQEGRYAFHAQAGHPLGVADFSYPGEVALGILLSDPAGELAQLQRSTRRYPPRLREALVEGLWEASFTVAVARKAVARADTTYVAGCLFRAVLVCAHALHASAGRWVVNEKGAVTAAGHLPGAPEGFAGRAHTALAHLGTGGDALEAAVTAVDRLVTDTTRA